jgi:hypothetical protein
MYISIVNLTKGRLSDEAVQTAIRAINRQIAEDFEPYWSFGARLRLEGPIGPAPRKQTLAEMRGDALIYIWDRIDAEDALGYHNRNNRGIPYSIVSLNEQRQVNHGARRFRMKLWSFWAIRKQSAGERTSPAGSSPGGVPGSDVRRGAG